MDNYILELPNFVSHKMCNEIVKIIKNDERREFEPLTYSIQGEEMLTGKFSNTLPLGTYEEYSYLASPLMSIFSKLYDKYIEHLDLNFKHLNGSDYIHPYIREIESSKKVLMDSSLTVHELRKGNIYSWHHDQCWFTCDDFVQVIIYLNTLEEEDGGYTEFVSGKKVKPEIGKVLMYPMSWTFIHKGNEILSDNTKYICTGAFKIKFNE